MIHDDTKHGLTRRSLLLGAIGAAILVIVLMRLGYLQLFKQSYYELLSDENRLSLKVIPPKRGNIFDRDGLALAYNIKSFRAVLIPEILEINKIPFEFALEKLTSLIEISSFDLARIFKEKKRNQKFSSLVLKENISWQEVAKLELALLDFPGVQVEETEKRFYPFGEFFSHLIGYVGRISEKEERENDTQEYKTLIHADVKIGKSGIEKAFDSYLRGIPGLRKVEVNARGRHIRDLSQKDPISGQDLKLTLDLALQEKLMAEVGAFPSAAAVLMEIKTGDILALGSSPSYNPNLFSEGIPQNVWDTLRANPFNPLISKVWGGLYAPGSTFKMCVALAALEKGVIDEKTSVSCAGHITLGNHRFHCWKKEGHGRVTLKEALQRSCDVYFYEIAKRVGVDAIAEMASRLGIGERTPFNLSGMKHGTVPTKAWKFKKFHERWQKGETLITGIGQGYVLATPIELAVMTARLASGGLAVVPRIHADGQPQFESLGINLSHLNLVLNGMYAACNEPGGTSYRYRIVEPGLAMAGKTGTSQVRRISMKERELGIKNADLDWKFRHHALFVAYAPVQNPKYAICVLIEHGGDGGLVAVPLAQRLLLDAQKRDVS